MLFHFGLARLIWDWIILFLVAYLSFMIPFNVAFKLYDGFKWLVVDIAVELMFIADIVVNFRTTYIDKKSGRIISQQKQIALNYLKGWFALDLLATIPFELLYFVDDSWVSKNIFGVLYSLLDNCLTQSKVKHYLGIVDYLLDVWGRCFMI